MSKNTRTTFAAIFTKLGLALPKQFREDHHFNEYLLSQIKVALDSYDPTSPATGNAVVGDVLLGKTFSNATGVGRVGTLVPLDTSDATAIALDIKLGETAYVDGEKITGAYDFAAATGANATATDILAPATAYVNGELVTGTQTLALMTADADAVAADIVAGKFAYVNGVKIEGTHV